MLIAPGVFIISFRKHLHDHIMELRVEVSDNKTS
jgi:hypothetical protein